MKIWYSPYELYPFSQLNRFKPIPRRGFLLKIQTADIENGFSDCHPLLEFGDSSCDSLLIELKTKTITSIVLKKSLSLARQDGRAREEKRSLYSNLKIKSHYTCSDYKSLSSTLLEGLLRKGFTTVKLKVGRQPRLEAQFINSLPKEMFQHLRWRFDANSKGGDLFIRQLRTDFLEFIDFIEDPFKFNKSLWKNFSQKYQVACAYDRPQGNSKIKDYSGIRILKPARESLKARSKDVITNCMDHPVGQSFAFVEAQKAIARYEKQKRDYGLQTAHLFKKNLFFAEIHSATAFFKPSDDGYGIGFERSLRGLPWRAL